MSVLTAFLGVFVLGSSIEGYFAGLGKLSIPFRLLFFYLEEKYIRSAVPSVSQIPALLSRLLNKGLFILASGSN